MEENDVFKKFLQEFIVPKVGIETFKNFKDVRNRRKVAKAIVEVINQFDIEVSDSELNKLTNNLENFENMDKVKEDQKQLQELEKQIEKNAETKEKGENDAK